MQVPDGRPAGSLPDSVQGGDVAAVDEPGERSMGRHATAQAAVARAAGLLLLGRVDAGEPQGGAADAH